MKYEISNPSDPVFMEAPDLEIAAIAVILLGGGKYGAEPVDGASPCVPIFMFGGADEWFTETFGSTIVDTLSRVKAARMDALADALQSTAYPSGHERTSMNRIVDRAHSLAKWARGEIEKAAIRAASKEADSFRAGSSIND